MIVISSKTQNRTEGLAWRVLVAADSLMGWPVRWRGPVVFVEGMLRVTGARLVDFFGR